MDAHILSGLGNLHDAFRVVFDAETSRRERYGAACDFLLKNSESAIPRILRSTNLPSLKSFEDILEATLKIVRNHQVQLKITDWPFENFWQNPREPSHSKLLGYFIDPHQEHNCGEFLLKKLLHILECCIKKERPHCRFPVDACAVRSEREYIDLCIERNCDDCKYAIIIENKINRARNQEEQLRTYAERVHKRDFKYEEIYVFYLPLASDQNPDRNDLHWLNSKNVAYQKITFDREILTWLDSALTDWPKEKPNQRDQCHSMLMREHVNYYRNLINHLNEKQKECKMNTEIFDDNKARTVLYEKRANS